MGLGSPLAAAFSKRYQPMALVSCKSVVSAPLRNAPRGCLARVLGLPRRHSATRVTPAGRPRSVRVWLWGVKHQCKWRTLLLI